MKVNIARRKALTHVGAAAVAIPVMLVVSPAQAKKADAMRTALKYQADPKGDAQCSTCLHYKGDVAKGAQGTCAIIPGDTEIDATGWCTGFVKKP